MSDRKPIQLSKETHERLTKVRDSYAEHINKQTKLGLKSEDLTFESAIKFLLDKTNY